MGEADQSHLNQELRVNKFLTALLLLTIPFTAHAVGVDVILDITLPTEYNDGTPVEAGELQSVAFYQSCDTGTPVAWMGPVATDSSPYVFSVDLPEGDHWFCFTVMDIFGFEGELSNIAGINLNELGILRGGAITQISVVCTSTRCRARVL